MKLSKIEKWFINKEKHSVRIIEKVERLLSFVDIKPGQLMLEIGCGNGSVSKHIYDKYNLNVTGTDVDKEQIEFAKNSIKYLKNITFLFADATNLPFKNENFDILLSINVLHHIYNWIDALKEINRVLKNSGYLILADMFFNKFGQKTSRLYSKKAYGITTMDSFNSFITDNNYLILKSEVSKSLMWNNIEAVYRKA
jgi:ubiquinone/menaquinone biosynthesis C-methylase UbiE